MVNHSCDPCLRVEAVQQPGCRPRLLLWSTGDVVAGEELTLEYMPAWCALFSYTVCVPSQPFTDVDVSWAASAWQELLDDLEPIDSAASLPAVSSCLQQCACGRDLLTGSRCGPVLLVLMYSLQVCRTKLHAASEVAKGCRA